MTHLVGRGGKGGASDGVDKGATGYGNCFGVAHFGHIGECLRVLTSQTVFAFAGGYINAVGGIVNAEGQRNVVKRFEDVDEQFGGYGNVGEAFQSARLYFYFGDQGGLEVGGSDGEEVLVEMEQEAVDDRHGVVIGDNTADGLDLLGKHQAVDDELHIVVSFNYLIID